jgi:FkbM family methyltransferase
MPLHQKPQNPFPRSLQRILHHVLPYQIYRKYIGRHEDGSLRLWQNFAKILPQESVILDIGAYHGEYSLAAILANPSAKVFAFEPDPKNLEVLLSKCDRNRIEIVSAAVAENTGTVSFVSASAQSRMIKEDESCLQGKVMEVQAIALDAWTAEGDINPSLIKIDVEGAEAGILRGAKRLLHKDQPIIICEVLSDSAGAEVMAELPPFYMFWYIDENSGVSEKKIITRRYWRNKNWLLLPENKINLMAGCSTE